MTGDLLTELKCLICRDKERDRTIESSLPALNTGVHSPIFQVHGHFSFSIQLL